MCKPSDEELESEYQDQQAEEAYRAYMAEEIP